MNNINNQLKYVVFACIALMLVFGAISIAPTQAQACVKVLGFLDPTCVLSGKVSLPALPSLPGISSGSASKTVNTTNTYTNSNNTNSNVNSPNSSVGGTQPVAYNYNTTPVYNYNTYPSYPTNYPSLQVSCYPMPLNARTGDTITWYASAYGGNGSYNYTWSGNDSLSGYGQSISKTYYSSGYKNASVTVVSGGQTVSKNCDGSVNVRGDYNTYYPPTYYPPTYYPPTYNYYSPLSVSCLVSGNTYANTNNALTWNAYPSGGNGSYSYSWSGTDGIYGSSQSVYYTYPNPGVKYASVTVYSNGQSVTQNCGSANVGGYYYGGTTYIQNQNNNSGLDIACYSDPRTVTVNQPATWITEVTGGIAPYTYTWSGTNDLSGNTSSVIKYYGTTGSKSAIVTVRSADGRSETRACSTSVTVRSASAPAPTVQAPAPVQPDNSLSAAALFSLKNVPWGWVAILIILVLFGTVIYLIYNRPKI